MQANSRSPAEGLHRRSMGNTQAAELAMQQPGWQGDCGPQDRAATPRTAAAAAAVAQPPQQPAPTWLLRQQLAATQPGVLVLSRAAFAALLLGPLLLWCTAVLWGISAFRGVPARTRDVQHLMLWFDVGIFRTVAGPALPLLVLLLRRLTLWGATFTPSQTAAAAAQPACGSGGLAAASAAAAAAGTGKRAAVDSEKQALLAGSQLSCRLEERRAVCTTLAGPTLLLYCLLTAARMVVYVAHLALTRPAVKGAPGHAYMSDHLLLGASVVACLQVELLCAASDAVKVAVVGALGFARELASAANVVLCALLLFLVCADMHFTARHYHAPPESRVALLWGAILFQVPALAWVSRKWASSTSNSTSGR